MATRYRSLASEEDLEAGIGSLGGNTAATTSTATTTAAPQDDWLTNLYQTAFNRAPDVEGYNFWMSASQQGWTPEMIEQQFLASPEYKMLQSSADAGATNTDDTSSGAYTPDQYTGAGKWIAENLGNPQLIAQEIQNLGLSQEDVLRAVQTQNPNFTLGDVTGWLSDQGVDPWSTATTTTPPPPPPPAYDPYSTYTSDQLWELESQNIDPYDQYAAESYFTGVSEPPPVVSTTEQEIRNLYQKYFNRAPDPEGLAFWVTAGQQGWTPEMIEQQFAASPEYQAIINPAATGTTTATTAATEAVAAPDVDKLKTQLLEQWSQVNPEYLAGTLAKSGLTIDQLATQFAQQAANAGITDLSQLTLGSTTEQVAGPEGETGTTYADVVRNYLNLGDKKIGYVGEGQGQQYLDDPDAVNRALYSYAFGDPTSAGRLFGTAEGEGWTAGDVVQGADGKLYIIPSWGSSSDAADILKAVQLGLMFVPMAGQGLGSLVSSATGMGLGTTGQTILGNALIGGTLSELGGGDFLKGAVTSGLTAGLTSGVSDFFGPALKDIGSSVASATGSQVVGDAVTNALQRGLVSGTTALLTGNSALDAAINSAIQGFVSSSVTGLTGEVLADVPAPIRDAATSAAVAAAQGGDSEAITQAALKSLVQSTINQLKQDEATKKIVEAAYADTSRAKDVAPDYIKTLTDAGFTEIPGALPTLSLENIMLEPLASGVAAPVMTGGKVTSSPTTTTSDKTLLTSGIPTMYEVGQAVNQWRNQFTGSSTTLNNIVADVRDSLKSVPEEYRVATLMGMAEGLGDQAIGAQKILLDEYDKQKSYADSVKYASLVSPSTAEALKQSSTSGTGGGISIPIPEVSLTNIGQTSKEAAATALDLIKQGQGLQSYDIQKMFDDAKTETSDVSVLDYYNSQILKGVGEQLGYIGTFASWFGADRDNALYQVGKEIEDYGQSLEPKTATVQQKNIVDAVSNATGENWFDTGVNKLIAGVTSAVKNPLGLGGWLISEGVQEVLPLGLATTVGRAVDTATKIKYGQQIASKFGLGSAVATDAAVNAFEAAAAQSDDVYRTLVSQGVPKDKASEIANIAGAGSGAITLVTSFIGDSKLVGSLLGNVKNAAIKSLGVEAPTEYIEGATDVIIKGLATGKEASLGEVLTGGTIESIVGGTTSGGIATGSDIANLVGGSTAGATSGPTTVGTSTAATPPGGGGGGGDGGGGGGGDSGGGGGGGGADIGGKHDDISDIGEDKSGAETLPPLDQAAAPPVVSSDDIIQKLEDSGLQLVDDAEQAIANYTNTVLSGGDISASGLTPDTVLATDIDGNTITAGDLGLFDTTDADTTAVGKEDGAAVSTPAAPAAVAPDTVVATDAEGNPVTAGDISAMTGGDTSAGTTVSTDPATGATTQTATDPATNTTTTTTADPSTNTQTQTVTDSSTGVETTTTTDNNTGAESTTTTDGNTQSTVTTDPNTGSQTQTTTDNNTGAETTTTTDNNTQSTVTTDPNTNTQTQTTTDSNTGVDSTTTVDSNTGVATTTTTDSNTNTTTQTTTDANTNTQTQTTTDNNTNVTTTVTANPNTNTTTTVTTDPNTNTTTETTTNTNTNTETTVTTNTDTGIKITTETDLETGETVVKDVDVVEPVDVVSPEVVTPPVAQPPVKPPAKPKPATPPAAPAMFAPQAQQIAPMAAPALANVFYAGTLTPGERQAAASVTDFQSQQAKLAKALGSKSVAGDEESDENDEKAQQSEQLRQILAAISGQEDFADVDELMQYVMRG